MAKQTQHLFRLGLFVTVSILLFIAATYLIGNNQNLFRPTFRVSSLFSNVNGLQKGNNVRYAGIKVGTVERIVILDDSTLRVDMQLEQKVQEYIRKNAVASIGSDGLVGSMIVNISPGKGDAPLIEDNDVLISYSRLKTDDILNTLGKTNENLAVLSNDLLVITERIIEGKGTLGRLLRDSVMANNMRQTFLNLQQTTANLNQSSRELNNMLSHLKSGEGLVGMLLYDTTLTERIDTIIARVDEDIITDVDSLVYTLSQSGDDIRTIASELATFSQALNAEQGLLHTAVHDTTVSEDLREIITNVNQSTELLNENLEAMRENFLFRKYFKQQEKEMRKAEKQEAKEARQVESDY